MKDETKIMGDGRVRKLRNRVGKVGEDRWPMQAGNSRVLVFVI